MKIGLTSVVGDLFHVGHLNLLKQGKKHCDFLIVGVLPDNVVGGYKRTPIIPFEERKRIIEALKIVDLVIDHPLSRDTDVLLEKLWDIGIKVDVLFRGNDWLDIKGKNWIENHGGKYVSIPYYHPQSTTKIINKIKRDETWLT